MGRFHSSRAPQLRPSSQQSSGSLPSTHTRSSVCEVMTAFCLLQVIISTARSCYTRPCCYRWAWTGDLFKLATRLLIRICHGQSYFVQRTKEPSDLTLVSPTSTVILKKMITNKSCIYCRKEVVKEDEQHGWENKSTVLAAGLLIEYRCSPKVRVMIEKLNRILLLYGSSHAYWIILRCSFGVWIVIRAALTMWDALEMEVCPNLLPTGKLIVSGFGIPLREHVLDNSID